MRMGNNYGNALSSQRRAINRIVGKKTKEYRLLGVPFFVERKRDIWHIDWYICGIPFLRIIKEPKHKGISLLIFTWFFKAMKHLFTKWEFEKQTEGIRITFAGYTVYQEKVDKPFRFPTANFRA